MYLFNRTGRLRPAALRGGMAWAVGITEKVNQITSLDVGLWQSVFSPGVGTLAWTCAVEDLTALDDANAKLAVDEGYLAEIEKGAAYMHEQADDRVAQFIHNAVAAGDKSAKYAAVVQSQLANGGFAKGVEAGVEIAMRATQLGGLPTSFLLATTGEYGGCLWVTAAESIAELERGEQAANMDAGFVQYIDEVSPGCFLPAVTTQSIYMRII